MNKDFCFCSKKELDTSTFSPNLIILCLLPKLLKIGKVEKATTVTLHFLISGPLQMYFK